MVTKASNQQSGLGIAGMIIGIISLLLSCLVIGGVTGIVGIILSIIAITQKGKKKGMAIAGIVLNALAIIIMIIMLVAIGSTDTDAKAENNSAKRNQKSESNIETSTGREESSAPGKNTSTPEPTADSEITLEKIKEQAQELKYKDIMRNPEKYKGQYFFVTVKILTVENGSLFSSYDKAYKAYTNDEYGFWLGDMIYLLDNRDTKSDEYIRILEDDIIIAYGRFDDLVQTKNALNGTKSEEMSLQLLYVELISE